VTCQSKLYIIDTRMIQNLSANFIFSNIYAEEYGIIFKVGHNHLRHRHHNYCCRVGHCGSSWSVGLKQQHLPS
jgi:hypothetical protein